MSLVHGGQALSVTEVADADGGVGAVVDGEGADVSGPEAGGRRASGVLGVKEDCACGSKLLGDGQRRGRRG